METPDHQREQRLLSTDNSVVKSLRALHRAVGREQQRGFLVEGMRSIEAFIAAGWSPDMLLVRADETVPPHWSRLPVRAMSDRAAARLSQASTPSGFLAKFSFPDQPALDPALGGLLLCQMNDPGNAGTLIRSSVAFGHMQVVLINSADPYAHKVVQSSAGALAAARLYRYRHWSEFMAVPGRAPLCALVVSGGQPPEALASRPRWLVIGNEARGLDEAVVTQCDERLTLPMPGGSESLNAAVAGSIACYALQRTKN